MIARGMSLSLVGVPKGYHKDIHYHIATIILEYFYTEYSKKLKLKQSDITMELYIKLALS